MICERKSISDIRKRYLAELRGKMQLFHEEIRKTSRGFISPDEYQILHDLQITFEIFADEIVAELRNGSYHALGSLEDEFLLKLNPEKLGLKNSLKDSQIFSKLLREIRSALRRRSSFGTNIGAKFEVDMVFPVVYKTAQGNLITVLDIVSNGQLNVKGIILLITKDGKDIKSYSLINYLFD